LGIGLIWRPNFNETIYVGPEIGGHDIGKVLLLSGQNSTLQSDASI